MATGFQLVPLLVEYLRSNLTAAGGASHWMETREPAGRTSPPFGWVILSDPQLVGVWTHPLAGSHESVVQPSLSSQLSGEMPTHEPFWHMSFVVQTLPSSQVAVLLVCMQLAVGVPALSHLSSVQGL